MFKSKITVSVMLIAVCGSLFLCVSEYLSGSGAWVAWAFTSAFGIGALIFVILLRRWKR